MPPKNNKKAPQKGNQNKNQHPKGNNPKNLPQNKIQERNLGSRNDLNLKSSMYAQSKIQHLQSNYRTVIPSVSYSEVVSGQIRGISHVNTPNSNFSTIFTNVIQIANDEGVDEELLARAFQAALRKLSHPDDKACEIFQAYVALKMGVIMLPTIQLNFQTCNQSQLVFGTQTVSTPKFMKIRTAGGTAIYCKSNFVQSRAPLPGIQYMDATAIKINNFPPLRIVSAYARFCAEINRKFSEKDFLKILNSDDLCSDHLPVILALYTNSDTMKIPAQLSTNWENFQFLLKNKPLLIPVSPSNEHLDVAIGRLGENISEALVTA
ncbi:hypothetical protein TNCV_5125741 [Trichonephila clavipes]|nr:hypothetical protein TNCV_5125741 [Trichonephila clavipes]